MPAPLRPLHPLAPAPALLPLPALLPAPPLAPLLPLAPWFTQGQRMSSWANADEWEKADDERRTRPWHAAPHYYRPETQAARPKDYNSMLTRDERHITGAPFFDAIYKGNWILPTPYDTHGAPPGGWLDELKPKMRAAEIALLLIWMVKKEIISPLTFPFLMMFVPLFTDGQGNLSFMKNMRGALPDFQQHMGEEIDPNPSPTPTPNDYYGVSNRITGLNGGWTGIESG